MTFGSVAVWPHGCSGRRRARPPARLGALTSFGAAPRSPPVPSGPSGALHTSGAVSLCVAERVGSKPGQAPPPPTGTAARPTNPSGALHTCGAHCAHVLSWPHRHPPAPRSALAPLIPAPTTNFARNSPSTLSNFEFRTLELQRFQSSLKLLPIELRATFLEGRP